MMVFSAACLMLHVAHADETVNQQIVDLRKKIDELTKLAEQYQGTVLQKQKEADTLKRQIAIYTNQILKENHLN